MTDEDIVQRVNGLSDDAYYIAGQYYFGNSAPRFHGGALMVVENSRQQAAFDSLSEAGFAYVRAMDGRVGYAATEDGVRAYQIIAGTERARKEAAS